LQEDSRFRQSDSLDRIVEGHGNEIRFTPPKVPPSQPFDAQIEEQECIQIEESRADKIEKIRTSFGALDHDRPKFDFIRSV
jgi:hypothetical protein